MADRARAARDQDGLALDRPVGEQAAVRGHRRHAETRTELDGDAVRQRHRLMFGHHRPLRGGSPPTVRRRQPGPHPLADAALVDARADRVDHSRAIVVRDLEAVDGPGRGPAAGFPVGRVDPGRLDPDPDLPRSGLRPLDVLDPQHLAGRPVPVIQRSLHRVLASGPSGRSARQYSLIRALRRVNPATAPGACSARASSTVLLFNDEIRRAVIRFVGQDAHLVPAGALGLAERRISGSDQFCQGAPGFGNDRDTDGNR